MEQDVDDAGSWSDPTTTAVNLTMPTTPRRRSARSGVWSLLGEGRIRHRQLSSPRRRSAMSGVWTVPGDGRIQRQMFSMLCIPAKTVEPARCAGRLF